MEMIEIAYAIVFIWVTIKIREYYGGGQGAWEGSWEGRGRGCGKLKIFV